MNDNTQFQCFGLPTFKLPFIQSICSAVSHWIFPSNDLFKNTDSLRNKTLL